MCFPQSRELCMLYLNSNSQDGPMRSWGYSLRRMLKQRLGEAAALGSGRTGLPDPHSD